MYCVAIAFKMTEQVERWICIKFCVRLEHSSMEIFGWFRRPQPWAIHDWQLRHDNVPAHTPHLTQSFLAKHQITQVTQPRYSPDLVPSDFWVFPQTKITFEREEISDHQWDSGKYDGAADGNWENCVRSHGGYFEGEWDVIVLCTAFHVSSLINVSTFHITCLDTVWTDIG